MQMITENILCRFEARPSMLLTVIGEQPTELVVCMRDLNSVQRLPGKSLNILSGRGKLTQGIVNLYAAAARRRQRRGSGVRANLRIRKNQYVTDIALRQAQLTHDQLVLLPRSTEKVGVAHNFSGVRLRANAG
ncbi:hypothetical protein EVAR_37144_1 [Eumeta japonica]|uniref:Uncharacterized protein n=1 Tax=Eumeta variegata TaxID=151549 RepID=A0A4C1WLH2_EUMVA|nr:hypothetical protein EVAR_37144_1 [Eumeta japonica]